MLRLHTDGSYSHETGVGSWAWLLVGKGGHELGSGAVAGDTTHQRMDLTAALEGLAAVSQGTAVELISDSTYVVDALRLGYLERWRAGGWTRIAHTDLWQGLAELADQRHVLGTWVRAHSGENRDPRNVMADHLAKTARRLPKRPSKSPAPSGGSAARSRRPGTAGRRRT